MFESPLKRVLAIIGIIMLVGVGVFFTMNGGGFLKGDFSFDPKKPLKISPKVDPSLYTQTAQSAIPVMPNPATPANQLIVYRSSPPVYNDKAADASGASPANTLLLSQFTLCANTPNPVIISSISLDMYARAHVAFNAEVDGTALWPQPLTYFYNYGDSFDKSYDHKTFDFMFEKPFIISPGGCKKMNVFATSFNQKFSDAHWVLPLFKGVKANYPATFLEKANATTLPTSLSSSAPAFGFGTLTLFDEPGPGPLYISKSEPQTYTQPANPISSGNYYTASSSLINRFHNPVHITSLTFVLESTLTTQSFPLTLEANEYLDRFILSNSSFSGDGPFATMTKKNISITPYKPLTVPFDMTLPSFGRAKFLMELDYLPYVAASYRLKLVGVGTDAPIKLIDPNSEMSIGVQVLGTFAQSTFSTQFFTVTDKSGKTTTPSDPPTNPSDKKDCSDCPDPDAGLSDVGKAAKSAESLYGEGWGGKGVYSVPDAQKIIDNNQTLLIGSFNLTNVNNKTTIPYNLNAGLLTVKSDLKTPLNVVLILNSSTGSATKISMVVTPGKPVVIPPQWFKGYLIMNIALESLPSTVQQSFFVQAVINGMDVVYDSSGSGYTKGAKVALFEDLGSKSVAPKLTAFPYVLSPVTFKQPGLYETSTTNIAPPYTEVVDAATLDDGKPFTMSSFCLVSTAEASVQNFVFQHVIRDTSPFTSISFDSGNVDAMLTKDGWSKKTATFSYTTPLPLYAGENRCFNLTVFGPVSDDLVDMYFDLTGVKAVDKDGNTVPMYLKNGKQVGEFNPLKGTQYSFL